MYEISEKPSTLYKILHKWVDFVFNKLYYRNIYHLNKENIPPAKTPTICVTNHQNSLADALAMLFAYKGRFIHFISRADVFKNKHIAKILGGLGLIPIYRIRDGQEKIKDNLNMFNDVEKYISNGNTLVIYPEATHMCGNWLGRFYISYIRIAFEAAACKNFEQEVFILPAALYYKEYMGIQSEFLIDFCKPVSLKPFYDKYKENPRQTQEELNEMIRAMIKSKVLDIKDHPGHDINCKCPDESNYKYIMNFFKFSESAYAKMTHRDEDYLPANLYLRKDLEKKIEEKQQSNPEMLKSMYEHTGEYEKLLNKYHINDRAFLNPLKKIDVVKSVLSYLILLPFYLTGMIPHILLYKATPFIMKNIEDKLMQASIEICVYTFGIPVLYLIYFIILVCSTSWLFSLVFIGVLPIFGKFAIWYHKSFQQDLKGLRAMRLKKHTRIYDNLFNLRKNLDDDLIKLCN